MNFEKCWDCKYLIDIEYEDQPKTKIPIKNEEGVILSLCETRGANGPVIDITCAKHQKPHYCTNFKKV